jgi:AmpD protein
VIVASDYTVNPVDGLITPARLCRSPNRDDRPAGVTLDAIILHGISLPPGNFGGSEIEDLFLNRLDWDAHPYFAEIRAMEVSAHLLIRRDGELVQFVPFTERAWHAGASFFRGRARCNDFSIGIELEGEDETAYDDRQYAVLPGVLQALCSAYPNLSPRELAGHCDVAPGRKSDPGPAFDWLRLYDALGEQLENKSCI